jgi:DNA-binding response OmpR family regulator
LSRILVIDDEAALGENIARMLRLPDTAVSIFVDPAKGLAECLANPPDLVLLDVRMPGMSGEEVFARLTNRQLVFPPQAGWKRGTA